MKIFVILQALAIFLVIGSVLAADNTSIAYALSEGVSGDETSTVSTDPDYETIFPSDKVQRIDIAVTPENWQKMLDNMTELYGEFGTEEQMHMPGNFSPEKQGTPGAMPMDGGPGKKMDTNPVWVPADVTFNGTTLEDVGIRFKGFSSLSGSWREGTNKISLKLDFDHYEDDNPELKNQKLNGFGEVSLQSGFGDNSLIKDKVVAEIFRSAGVPAPDTAFYRVYLDTGNGSTYAGLYTMIEDVADTMLETQFGDDSGNLYKPQGEHDATFVNGTFNESFFEKETNKKANDFSDLENLYAALNSDLRTSDPAAWRAGLESVLDVPEFLTWLATNMVIQNWDTYGSMAHNFYLYTNPETGLITWIPWDNNFALQNNTGMGDADRPGFGNETRENFPAEMSDQMPMPPGFGNITEGPGHGAPGGGMGASTRNLNLSNVTDDWPLIRYLMDDPVYYADYVAAVEKVINESFDPEEMAALYTKNHDLISPYVVGDEGEQAGFTHLKDPQDFIDSLETLTNHASSRYNEVMTFLAEEKTKGGVS